MTHDDPPRMPKASTLRSEPLPAKKKNQTVRRAASTRGFRLGSKKKDPHKKLSRSRTAEVPEVRARSKSPNPPSEARLRMLERANARINSLHPKKKHKRARSREIPRSATDRTHNKLRRHKSHNVNQPREKKDPTSPRTKGMDGLPRRKNSFRLGSRKFSEEIQRRKSSMASVKKTILVRGLSADRSESTKLDPLSAEFESISFSYAISRENSESPEKDDFDELGPMKSVKTSPF